MRFSGFLCGLRMHAPLWLGLAVAAAACVPEPVIPEVTPTRAPSLRPVATAASFGPPVFPTPRPRISPPRDVSDGTQFIPPTGGPAADPNDGTSQVPGVQPGQGSGVLPENNGGGAGGGAGGSGGSGSGAGGSGSGGASGGQTLADILAQRRFELPILGLNALSLHRPNLPGDNSSFQSPAGVVWGPGEQIFIADAGGHRVWVSRLVEVAQGVVRQVQPYAGDGTANYLDALDVTARFNTPHGLALSSNGRLLITDTGNHCVRMILPSAAGGGVQMVSTLAGKGGTSGYMDEVGASALFNQPWGIVVDAEGNAYVSERGNHCIRKITPAGVVTTLAGQSGTAGHRDGDPRTARFSDPRGLAIAPAGDIFVADTGNHCIRRIAPNGQVTTYAGVPGSAGFKQGLGAEAQFNAPVALARGGEGTLYVLDSNNRRVRRVTTDTIVSTYGGSGEAGVQDGPAPYATFQGLAGVAWDGRNNLVLTESTNRALRNIRIERVVTTDFGYTSPGARDDRLGEARFRAPTGMAFDRNGLLYVADAENHTVRRINLQGEVTTLAGLAGQPGNINGTLAQVRFRRPRQLVVDLDGVIYVADTGNHCIRRIGTDGTVTTLAGGTVAGFVDAVGSAARFNLPSDVTIGPDGNLIVTDAGNHRVRLVSPTGTVTTLAGAATPGFQDGSGADARFFRPMGVVVNRSGRIFIVDQGNHAVRSLTRNNDGSVSVQTLAGVGGAPGYRDGEALGAQFNEPGGISLDGDDRLYIADTGNSLIRRVDPNGQVLTYAGLREGSPSRPRSGFADGLVDVAQFSAPEGVLVDLSGYVHIADTANNCLRRIH
jgi:streptogramin lyase